MNKTYSIKSSAVRAAKVIPGATVKQIETPAGYAYEVILPSQAEGIDGPAADDMPIRQISDDDCTDIPIVKADSDIVAAFGMEGLVDAGLVSIIEDDDGTGAEAVAARNAARFQADMDAQAVERARVREAATEAEAAYMIEKVSNKAASAKAGRKLADIPPGIQVGGPPPAAVKAAQPLVSVKNLKAIKPAKLAVKTKKADKTPKVSRTGKNTGELGLSGTKLALLGLLKAPNGVSEAEGCAILCWAKCTATILRVMAQATEAGMTVRKWKGDDKKTRYAVAAAGVAKAA